MKKAAVAGMKGTRIPVRNRAVFWGGVAITLLGSLSIAASISNLFSTQEIHFGRPVPVPISVRWEWSRDFIARMLPVDLLLVVGILLIGRSRRRS